MFSCQLYFSQFKSDNRFLSGIEDWTFYIRSWGTGRLALLQWGGGGGGGWMYPLIVATSHLASGHSRRTLSLSYNYGWTCLRPMHVIFGNPGYYKSYR